MILDLKTDRNGVAARTRVVDAALARANQILTLSPCSAARAVCAIEISRSAKIEFQNDKTGVVRTLAELKERRRLFRDIEIFFVKRVEPAVCRGVALGCYIQDGPADPGVIIIGNYADLGQVLAHEWGHRRTLNHSAMANALMNCRAGPDHVRITSPEWNTLLDPLKYPAPKGIVCGPAR